jgi:hypothetical protein
LGSQPRFLRCNARLPERYIETENRRRTEARVFKSPILPRWLSNQWFTDSLENGFRRTSDTRPWLGSSGACLPGASRSRLA